MSIWIPNRYTVRSRIATGFSTTDGVNNNDGIAVPYTRHSTTGLRTISFWGWRTTDGTFDRIFDKRDVSGDLEAEQVFWDNDQPFMYHQRRATNGSVTTHQTSVFGDRSARAIPYNEWFHACFTHDERSITTNDGHWWLNGGTMFPTDPGPFSYQYETATSDILRNNTARYHLGHRFDNQRTLRGRLSEFAVWDRILSATEIQALYAGKSPMQFERNLVMFVPLDETNMCWVAAD